jgi:Cys-tRNA(Pro)/Cys-tRNA(Cys) deacylase
MAKETPATVALRNAGIAFSLHEYDYEPGAEGVGVQAAEAMGIEPARLLKTLMAKAGAEVVCVLAPSGRDISLKRLAAAAGGKDAAMLPVAEAERITGYRIGGISPFGQRRRVRVFMDESALAFTTVMVNGGRRGLEIEIAPGDIMRLLEASATKLA